MGEAKRRKALGSNYGKPKIKCFLAKAQMSDCHAIYLRLPNDNRDRIVSVHEHTRTAYETMSKCNDTLSKMIVSAHQDPDIVFTGFIRKLIDEYGDYESDDAEYFSSVNGITAIKPPIIKKYIVISCSTEESKLPVHPIHESQRIGTSKNETEDYDKVYFVARMTDPVTYDLTAEDITTNLLTNLSHGILYNTPVPIKRYIDKHLTVNNTLCIFSSYVTAAYVADFMNENHLDPEIDTSLLKTLWAESNQMQRKI